MLSNLFKKLSNLFKKFKPRFAAVLDKSALFLILPALAIVACIDMPRTISVVTWMLFAAILVGFCIQISRAAWSPINLVALIDKASQDPRAAATVVAAVIHFVGLLVVALVLWTRP